MSYRELYKSYDEILYISLKCSMILPAVILGNALDLCLLGYSKRHIDVTTQIKKLNFFRPKLNSDEACIDNNTILNKGFAGILRLCTTAALILPLEVVSPALAVIFTALHTILKPVVEAIEEPVYRNFCL